MEQPCSLGLQGFRLQAICAAYGFGFLEAVCFGFFKCDSTFGVI